jgi:hypothetical protein|tara:strand:+ start:1851 stop:1991 length:141 start_codon:yes stop_codon:yes gene_type:complete
MNSFYCKKKEVRKDGTRHQTDPIGTHQFEAPNQANIERIQSIEDEA